MSDQREHPRGALDGTDAFKVFTRSLYRLDGPLDLKALRGLKGVERRTARTLVIDQLHDHPNDARLGRAIIALSDPQLLPATREAFVRADTDHARAALAVALRSLGVFEQTAAPIQSALRSACPKAKIVAIKALTNAFPGPVDEALSRLAGDEDEAVKAAAEEAIERRHNRWGEVRR